MKRIVLLAVSLVVAAWASTAAADCREDCERFCRVMNHRMQDPQACLWDCMRTRACPRPLTPPPQPPPPAPPPGLVQ